MQIIEFTRSNITPYGIYEAAIFISRGTPTMTILTLDQKQALDSAFAKFLQQSGTFVNAPFSFSDLFDVTTGPIILFVGTNGSDSNSGTDVNAPCLTIQGALNKLPKKIKHPVTINVAAGTYGAFLASGFQILPADNYLTDTSYLHIKGTMVQCVPASTGSATGTLSSFANTNFTGTFAVCTDSSNNMTVNEYEGCYLEFLTGTGSISSVAVPARALIVSNDNTSFTCLIPGTAPAANTTYRVIKPASSINIGLGGNPLVAANNPSQIANPTGGSFAACWTNCSGLAYAMSDMDLTLSSTLIRGIILQESRLRVSCVRIIGASGSSLQGVTFGTVQQSTSAFIASNTFINFTGSSSSTCMLFATTGAGVQQAAPSLSSCYIKGGIQGLVASNIGPPQLNTCMFKSQTTASIVSAGGMSMSQFGNVAIDGSATGIAFVESVNTGLGQITFGTNGMKISNCTVSGITLQGAAVSGALKTVSGTGNLVGLKVSRGAVCVIASDTTLTGTTEITVDGVTTSLTALRGATPKMVKNPDYLSRIYE